MSERISLNDDFMTMMLKMAEGNPGAASALSAVYMEAETIDPDSVLRGFGKILCLDSLGIYGTDIYVLWSDICNRNTVKMITLLRGNQLGFVSSALLKDISSRQDHSGKDLINVDDIYRKVCERLPNFDKDNRP